MQRQRAAVTQWIAEGKITGDGDALVGTGRSAMINREIAVPQVRERRSVNESCGLNGLNTKLEDVPAPLPISDVVTPKRPVPKVRESEDQETVDARIKAEKLKQNEILTRKQEMEELTRHGKWVLTADAAGQMNRVLAEMIRIFEGCFPDLASATAAKFQISQREVLHLLRTEFKATRAQLVAVRGAATAGGNE